MSKMTTRFESAKQDWTTPDDLFEPYQKEFKFTLDAAADKKNARAKKFFTQRDDALTQSWGNHRVWLNPPYGARTGTLQQWVRKAHQESTSGATVVMLVPARTNTNWFHDICLAHGEIRFIRGRPKFSGMPHGLPQPLCVVIFRPEAKI
jgi:site-specific DNA-methyltransferase (adenine-specific)